MDYFTGLSQFLWWKKKKKKKRNRIGQPRSGRGHYLRISQAYIINISEMEKTQASAPLIDISLSSRRLATGKPRAMNSALNQCWGWPGVFLLPSYVEGELGWTHSFLQSTQILSSYYVPGTVLESGDIAVNKTKSLLHWRREKITITFICQEG